MSRKTPIPPSPTEADYAALEAEAGPLTEGQDPFAIFLEWLEEAGASEPNDPNAMAVATVDPDGLPDVRMVLLKGVDADGFRFFTNYESLKGAQLAAHPQAALCFHWKLLREQMRSAKGVGNFKNLFLHVPNGKKDGVQIIPISEVAAKDEFLGIKNVTRDDMLVAHRITPQLIGVIPTNNGGFGDPRSAMDVFFRNEIEPLESVMLQINDITGLPVVNYRPYEPMQVASSG